MHVQVNTDNQINSSDDFARRVEAELRSTLARFANEITRVEVHLGDDNGERGGGVDKRCSIEARLAHRQPETVVERAPSLQLAFNGAAKKLVRLLDSSLGKVRDHKGAPTIRRAEI